MLHIVSLWLSNKLRDSDHGRHLPSWLGYVIVLIAFILGLICIIFFDKNL